jgi:WD40 repeat protein
MPRVRKWQLVGVVYGALAVVIALFHGLPITDLEIGVDPQGVLTGVRFPIQALAFSRDGTRLTTANYYVGPPAEEIEVTDWDVTSGQRTGQCSMALGAVRCAALAAGGRILVSLSINHGVWLWDREFAQPQQLLRESPHLVPALAFSEDGGLLATANDAWEIVVRDVAGRQPKALCRGHVDDIFALAFAPDGQTLASGGADTTLRLWDAATGEKRDVLQAHAHSIEAMVYAPDGRTLASADRGGAVVLWDVATRAKRATLATSGERGTGARDVDSPTAVAFSPGSRMLAVAVGRTVQLWDVATRSCLTQLTGHEGAVRCLAFSPDGTRLASGGHDRTVRLWEVARYRAPRP